jgi:hypothetical protein
MKKLPDFLLNKEEYRHAPSYGRTSTAFIDKTIQKLAGLVQLNHQQLHLVQRNKLISKISVRTRLIVFLYFILLISFLKPIRSEIIISAMILTMHLFLNEIF